MCLVNRRGLGKAKDVDMQNLWVQEASTSGQVRHEEGRHEREPTRLQPLPKPQIEQLMKIMGWEFMTTGEISQPMMSAAALDKAVSSFHTANKNPSRKIREIDNRGRHRWVVRY